MSRFLDIAVGCVLLPAIFIRALYDLIRGK
jgi:hypothetical protein